MSIPEPIAGLTAEGCRKRQERLRQHLSQEGLDGALISEPRHIHYFTGYFQRGSTAAAAWIPAHGPVALVTYRVTTAPAVDQCLTYTAAKCSTLVDDQPGGALQALLPALGGAKKLGLDQAPRPWLLAGREMRDLNGILLKLRRTKDQDEVALIRRSVAGVEAAYAAARQFLVPGMSEIEVYTRLQAAAIAAVGEPIGDFGNDFQSGTPGGPPRPRTIQAGELMPLDLSVIVRGYWADMCRTFCIGGKPTPAQTQAQQMVMTALDFIQRTAKPGTSCKKLYQDVHAMLDGKNGWSFGHHLGHGFGLSPHESPRLNPNYDDTLQVGDTLTCEPGIYGPDLNAGIRIEENFLVVPRGLERLSSFPTEL